MEWRARNEEAGLVARAAAVLLYISPSGAREQTRESKAEAEESKASKANQGLSLCPLPFSFHSYLLYVPNLTRPNLVRQKPVPKNRKNSKIASYQETLSSSSSCLCSALRACLSK